MGLSDKIKSLRERYNRRQKRKEAKRKKKQTQKAAEKLRSERRVKRNNPEGIVEEARASTRQAKMFASDLGISRQRGAKAKQSVAKVAEAAGDTLGELDVDGPDNGNGDGELLADFEAGLGDFDPGMGGGSDVDSMMDGAALDDPEDFDTGLDEGDIEDDLGL